MPTRLILTLSSCTSHSLLLLSSSFLSALDRMLVLARRSAMSSNKPTTTAQRSPTSSFRCFALHSSALSSAQHCLQVILNPGKTPNAPRVFLDFISYSAGPLPEELLCALSSEEFKSLLLLHLSLLTACAGKASRLAFLSPSSGEPKIPGSRWSRGGSSRQA
eukprot:748402-Hanusia_phi.AAC.2